MPNNCAALIDRDLEHRALYQVFLEVRDAAAKILEHTTLADIVNPKFGKAGKRQEQEESQRGKSLAHGESAGNPRRGKERVKPSCPHYGLNVESLRARQPSDKSQRLLRISVRLGV